MNKQLHLILSFLLGIIILLAYAWWSGWPAPILSVDVQQKRVNQALPLLAEGVVIRQGFVAQYDGLRQVEVQMAKFQGEYPDGMLILRLLDDAEQIVAQKTVETQGLTHNEVWKWEIERQEASAGRHYTLEVRSDGAVPFSLWGYTLDVLPTELVVTGKESKARDMMLVTRYELTIGGAFGQLVQMLQRDVGLFVLALGLMLLPGCLLLRLTHRWLGEWDIVAWWGCALALGLSLWPLIWYWMTLLGFKWSPLSLWTTLLWGWEAVIGLWVWQRYGERLRRFWSKRKNATRAKPPRALRECEASPWETSEVSETSEVFGPKAPSPSPSPNISSSKMASSSKMDRGGESGGRFHREHGLLLLIVLGGLAVRLLAVRELVFPLWVDSVRHALITQVMASKGQVLFDYAPFLPMIDRFPYHFGYHTISASLLMISSHSLPVLMLSLGQLLNALMPLTVYTAGWLMTKRRDVGVVAAFLVAFPFLFPGYYATWGRFTQLTGMLIMCVLVAMTWRLLRGNDTIGNKSPRSPHPPTADASPNNRRGGVKASFSPLLLLGEGPGVRAVLVGLLAAGLFLVHLRVFIFYLPFALVLWLYNKGQRTISLGAAALLGGLLVAPRIWYLKPPAVGNVFKHKIAGYNAFPTGYVTTGWEKYFIIAAGVSVLIVLIGRLRRTRWSALPLVLLLWVAMLFLLLGGEYVGLPESWVVNLNSMYITLFLPLALLLGITSTYLWRYRVFLVSSQKIGVSTIQTSEVSKTSEVFRPMIKQVLFLRGLPLVYRTILSGILYASLGALLTALLLFGIRHQITILNEQTILAYRDDLPALEWVAQNTPPSARFAVSSWLWLGNTWAGQDAGSWLVPLTGRYSSTPPADYVYNLPLHEEVTAFNEAAKDIKDWSDPSAATWLKEQGMTHIFIGTKPSQFTFSLDPAKLKANPAFIERYRHNGAFVFEIK